MRKTQKKILGIVGLVFVAVITIFAASLPSDVFALSSFSETVTIRVVGDIPDVTILTQPDDKLVEPSVTIPFNYENVEDIEITLIYTDQDGTETGPVVIKQTHPDYNAGEDDITVNFEDYGEGGYGYYYIEIIGQGINSSVSRYVFFEHVPLISNTEIKEEGADPTTKFIYDATVVCSAEINIYSENWTLVTPPSPIKVNPITNEPVTLTFEQSDVPSGNYYVLSTAYDCSETPQPIYEPYSEFIEYVSPDDIDVPETGFAFKNLNISRTDYLVTGLLLFFSFAILSIVFIKKDRNKKRR